MDWRVSSEQQGEGTKVNCGHYPSQVGCRGEHSENIGRGLFRISSAMGNGMVPLKEFDSSGEEIRRIEIPAWLCLTCSLLQFFLLCFLCLFRRILLLLSLPETRLYDCCDNGNFLVYHVVLEEWTKQ